MRRRTQLSVATWVAIIAASALVHAAVVATVQWDGVAVTRAAEPEPTSTASLVSYSCELEAAAGSAAQTAMCATPFGGNRDACLRRATNAHQLAYLGCQRRDDEVLVTMIDIDKFEPKKLLPIDPIDEVVAAQLLEEQIVKKVEEAQRQIQQRRAAGQVIEITQPRVEIRPENTRYVSEYDSQVEKQTVARASTEKMVSKPSPKELPVTTSPTKDPQEVATNATDTVGDAEKADKPGENPNKNDVEKLGEGKSNSVEKQRTSALAMRGTGTADRDPTEAMKRGALDGSEEKIGTDGLRTNKGDGARTVERTETEAAGGGDGGSTGGSAPNLRPNEETMTRAVGGGSVDKIDDAESGEFTALNSKKWKYASFFNRMKRRVAQHWHPDKVYMRRDPTGKVYGTKDRVTVLQITMTPKGTLSKVIVRKQSGIDFLDDEAVRAFREAGPFPNPPGGLVDSSGAISFSFAFHFEIGGRRDSWRIFRYR